MNKIQYPKSIKIILAVITFFVLLPVFLLFTRAESSQTESDKISPLSEGWYYIDGNLRIEVTLPAVITGIEGKNLTLYNNLLPAEESTSLTTRAAAYTPKVSLNDKDIYKYREGAFRRNGQMRSKVNCLFQLPTVNTGDTLSITYTRTENTGVFVIPEIYMGHTSAVILYYCTSNLFNIGIICLMYLLGMISFAIYCYMSFKHIQEPRLLNLTGFLLFCGTWCLTDSSLAQLFTGMTDTILNVSFVCFMLFSVPMVAFVQNSAMMKTHKLFDYITWMFYGNAIVQMLLHITLHIDMVDMLFATHLCLIAGISLLIIDLLREYKKSRNTELHAIITAFVLLSFFGVLALLLYWTVNFTYYQEIYECGILLFIILLLYRVLITQSENLQARTEMEVYLRLSKIDEMTNLKNRRSFNEDTESVQLRENAKANPLLIFFDLNYLKYTNDTHGHSAGDELILDAARILERVYGYDNCYRIGGDEFAVIINEPDKSPEDMNKLLNQEINRYNQIHSNELSIARGYSFLVDSQGWAKTVSDWKAEADQNMYKDKLSNKLRRARLPKDISAMELLLQENDLKKFNEYSKTSQGD